MHDEEPEEIELDFHPKSNLCELNVQVFRRLLDTYGKNVRFCATTER
jgi:hypothetical protein